MPLVNLARDMIAEAIIGGSTYTAFNNANAHLGVGNSNAAFSAAHTDLQGGSTSRRPMDATFPSRAANVVTWQATWGTGEANFDWQEIGFFNHVSAGQMLGRFLENIGVKTSSVTRQLEVTQTWVLV
jgi:hypothetical protein